MTAPSFKTLLGLCRASNLPTVWMNVLTAAILSRSGAPGEIALLVFGLSCFYCGGMAMNDLCDLKHDREHQTYRPIPAGRISVRAATVTTIALFTLALTSLVFTPNGKGLFAGCVLLLAIWVYNQFHKRHAATVLAMAAARLLVYIVTAMALTGDTLPIVWLAAIIQGVFVVAVTVVARFESRTVARRYSWPVIPWMIATMPLIDGCVLAVAGILIGILVGVAAMAMTRFGQRFVRGD